MGEIIFCKTRYQDIGYASYNDYWRLVELAGYPIIYVDQLDPQSDNTYIVTPLNDEWLGGWPDAKARIIHHELEWRTDWRAEVNEPPGIAEVWCSDKYMAHSMGARYIPLGSDNRLNEVGSDYPVDKVYDVSLLAYQGPPRRQKITGQLLNEGVVLAPSDNLWGRRRSDALLRSRAMVHVHQHDNIPAVAPLRWCLAAAHRLPMITESVNDGGIFGFSSMMQASYEYLVPFIKHMLEDTRMLENYGRALHNLLCEEMTFRKMVEAHV